MSDVPAAAIGSSGGRGRVSFAAPADTRRGYQPPPAAIPRYRGSDAADDDDDSGFADHSDPRDRADHAQHLLESISAALGPRESSHPSASSTPPQPQESFTLGRDDTIDRIVAEHRQHNNANDGENPRRAGRQPLHRQPSINLAAEDSLLGYPPQAQNQRRQQPRGQMMSSDDDDNDLGPSTGGGGGANHHHHQQPLLGPNHQHQAPPATAAAAPYRRSPFVEYWESEKGKTTARRAGIGCVGLLGFVLVLLLLLSLTPVERQRWGVRYNPNTGRILSERAVGNGNWFWSPVSKALEFPATWESMCFSLEDLEIAVNSGQVIRVEACLRFKLDPVGLVPMIRRYGFNFRTAIRAVARDRIKNAAPGFTFEQYVTDRDAVTDGLHAAVGAGLLAAGIDVTLPRPGFILGFVELPRPVLLLNQDVFYQSEIRIRNEFEKQAAIVRLATQTNVTRIDAAATATRAGAEATRTQLRAVAAHRGTAQLRSETGRLVKALAGRLGVATAAGHGALAEYSLLLAAVEGTVSTISPTPVEDAAAANAANATASGNNTSGETASAYARSFTLLDGDAAALGMTPLV